ncbi:MAG: hypothetical protein M3O34_01090 [Chloroflexota bacterium]|nr:hypothetical protein [Chloroflexota bacterium]
MIAEFEDSRPWLDVVVDVLRSRVARPGPAPGCSTSELMTMVLVGEYRTWDAETKLVASWPPTARARSTACPGPAIGWSREDR